MALCSTSLKPPILLLSRKNYRYHKEWVHQPVANHIRWFGSTEEGPLNWEGWDVVYGSVAASSLYSQLHLGNSVQ
jgi:hypothetical protein